MTVAEKSLFIIFSKEDVDSWHQYFDSSSIVFAFTEVGIDALREKNLSYYTLDDVLEDSYTSNIVFDKVRLLRDLCCRLDIIIESKDPKKAIQGFLCSLHLLRIPFFLYTYYIDHLDFLLKKFDPQKIYISNSDDTVNIVNILEALILKNNSRCKIKQTSSITENSASLPNWFQKSSPVRAIIKKLLNRSRYKPWSSLISGILRRRLFLNKKPVALVHMVDWEHDLILKKLMKSFNFIFTEDLSDKSSSINYMWAETIYRHFAQDPIAKEMKYKNVLILDFFSKEIKRILGNDWSYLKNTKDKIEDVFERFDFKFLFSSYCLPQTEILTSFFNTKNRPTFLMLHGGTSGIVKGAPYTPMSTHGNLLDYTSLLVYSNQIVEDCTDVKAELPTFTSKVVAVGDAYFQKFSHLPKSKKPHQKSKICYVFGGTGIFNATGKWGGCTDASLYNLRLKVLEIVNSSKRSDIDFVFKSGYGFESQNLQLIKDINRSSYCRLIDSNQKLTEFANDFDLFLIEIPSTSMLELMAMDKYIITYVDKKSMDICPGVKTDLSKSVTLTLTQSHFLNEIKKILKSPKLPKNDRSPRVFMHNFTGARSPEQHALDCETFILNETILK